MKIDFELELIFDGKPINLKEKYQEDVGLSRETINEDLIKQPALFAWYSVLTELCEAAYDQSKLTLELLEATLDEFYRKKLEAAGQKATETKLKMLVIGHKDRIDAVKNKIEMKKNLGILKALTESMRHRKEAVIAMASNYRAEMDVDVFIKKRELKKEKY